MEGGGGARGERQKKDGWMTGFRLLRLFVRLGQKTNMNRESVCAQPLGGEAIRIVKRSIPPWLFISSSSLVNRSIDGSVSQSVSPIQFNCNPIPDGRHPCSSFFCLSHYRSID